jgi:hypothetical protein
LIRPPDGGFIASCAPEPAARETRRARWLVVPVGAFALVALTVGLLARERFDPNKGAHSLLGCAVYGGFAAKVLIVRLHRFPVWVLPAAGGVLFGVLVAVWYTSAIWLLGLVGVGIRQSREEERRPAARGPGWRRARSAPCGE